VVGHWRRAARRTARADADSDRDDHWADRHTPTDVGVTVAYPPGGDTDPNHSADDHTHANGAAVSITHGSHSPALCSSNHDDHHRVADHADRPTADYDAEDHPPSDSVSDHPDGETPAMRGGADTSSQGSGMRT
jgi:hypothetical protein